MRSLAVAFGACRAFISGSGDWSYEYAPTKLALPESEADNLRFGNGHGLARDRDGNIYFTFDPKQVTKTTQVLAKFTPDGEHVQMLGAPGPQGLSRGVPHGLRIETDDRGEQFLYHANNAHLVFKTTLDGEILWTADFSHWAKEKPQFWPVKPTDAIVVPHSDVLLVADGYGSSFVHALNKTTGEFLEGRSFGGRGMSTSDPIKLNTPHGINLDPRRPGLLLISDRSNERLVWVTPEGKYIASKPMNAEPAGQELPCNMDAFHDKDHGLMALVPGLGMNSPNLTLGSVGIYGPHDDLQSVIEVAKTIGHLGHQHPHDAIFLENGDVVVCCWAGPSDPGIGQSHGTISYWKRLRKDAKEIFA